MPALEPCQPWITANDVPCGDNPADKATAAAVASSVLYVLSGTQFPGECSRTSRPGEDLSNCWTEPNSFWAMQWSDSEWAIGVWRTFGYRVNLGWLDVASIESVTIDGSILDPSEYRLEDYRYLVRVDGTPWPPNSGFVVEMKAGLPPPPAGILAAKALACEIIKLFPGGDDAECALPPNTRAFVRNGLSATMIDTSAVDPGEFKTGLMAVDLFLNTYNPEGLTAPPIVAIPGHPPYTHERT